MTGTGRSKELAPARSDAELVSVNVEHLSIIDGFPPAKPHMGSWEQRASS